MAVIECIATYCAICGVPICNDNLRAAWKERPTWFENHIVMMIDVFKSKFRKNQINSTSNIEREDLEFMRADDCDFDGYYLDYQEDLCVDHCFTMHSACQAIAQEVFDYVKHRDIWGYQKNVIRSHADLYLCLETQYEIDESVLGSNVHVLNWPNKSYGAAHFQADKGWNHVQASKCFETDPLVIHDVTDAILDYLKPLLPITDTTDPATTTLGNGFANLPPELQMIVLGHLESNVFENPSLVCTRIGTPHLWRKLLVRATPWLWDLELEIVDIYVEISDRYNEHWDWELLVRQVMQTNAFEADGCMSNVPLGLRNNRRIWRIFWEMETPIRMLGEEEGQVDEENEGHRRGIEVLE